MIRVEECTAKETGCLSHSLFFAAGKFLTRDSRNNFYIGKFINIFVAMKTFRRTFLLRKKLEHFETACREAMLKMTHQRMEIFRELAAADDHPTAETLYKRLRKTLPTLSLDTVYRTLTTFEDHDLISRVQTIESHARFEAEIEQHHHAICSRCNKITDFQWDVCDTNELPENMTGWGNIQYKQITLRGICSECAKAHENIR